MDGDAGRPGPSLLRQPCGVRGSPLKPPSGARPDILLVVQIPHALPAPFRPADRPAGWPGVRTAGRDQPGQSSAWPMRGRGASQAPRRRERKGHGMDASRRAVRRRGASVPRLIHVMDREGDAYEVRTVADAGAGSSAVPEPQIDDPLAKARGGAEPAGPVPGRG